MLATFRAVVVGGARQVGKTTLVRDIIGRGQGSVFTLDDDAVRRRAVEDPAGFVSSLPHGSVVDEFQRAGEPFLLAVKQRLDRDRSRGQLVLTGSTSYAASRAPVETLAGRVGRLTLWPLSQGELLGHRETLLDRLFAPDTWSASHDGQLDRDEVMRRVVEGGYPEVVTEELPPRGRGDWFRAYVTDVVSREALRPIADVRMERELLQVLRLLAARSAQELVVTDIARDAELARETATTYVALLEALHLVAPLPAWATSATTRAKRRAKIHLVDTGLACHLAKVALDDLSPSAASGLAGPFLESFVVAELQKQASWSEREIVLSHFRDRNGAEVDVIVEDLATGTLAGIEVKASATPTRGDARHLARLRDTLGPRFSVGLVVHTGGVSIPLGERLWAVPVDAIWAGA